ncbi:class I poly(R)-hydroxyalkanoic acid synthase [Sphingomonas sp. ABOLH]|uniref:PHA/PHB synthase family protein n=1 Tax=Sphingomonas sp. ABOLH TaxID=1985881 RepID=UPI000F7EDB2A|nr:class I poly(R)-hydroxyalkanoic acid synthase [Sphingomonas sp. ABOLH]RSV20324.1 class I poly(R)-hydroxyalkanoic acid synthase [Sphingomonas sp. ABOLH]
MTAESNMPPTTPMSLEDLQHWTQMLGRAQQMMLEQGIDLLERTPAIPDPTGMVKAQTDFWADTMKLWQRFLDPANAEPVEESPERARDKRFKAKQWHDDPLFAFIRQSYFLVADHMLKSVDALDGVEPKQKEQLRFATRGLIDAMSPTNFPATNPVVVEKIIETRGENLLKGLQNMLADMAKGQMTQSDTSAFELGRNVATTPGKVIKRTALYELIHYAPTTETVGAIPLLIFPPWINRFYILDLTAEKSFIRWAVEQGLSVFVVSWKSADASMKDVTWDDYVVRGQIDAIDTVRDLLGVESVHTIGYCVAGTTLAATLALLAARGEAAKVATATFFTAQVDFSQAGELSLFVDDEQLKLIRQVGQDGYLDGRYMAATFNLLRGRDLIWNYVTNNYLLGNDYAPFDLLHWNADVTNLPANWHLGYLTDLYRDNRLVQAGSMTVDEVPIDLSTVKTPAYIQAGREDHIAPAESVWKVTEHFTGPLRFVLAGSGHIAGVVNPPSAGKYQYWTNDEAADSLEAFVAGAKETKGSWWPDWRAWIAAADGATVPATGARVPGEGAMPALCDAPGEYVRTR